MVDLKKQYEQIKPEIDKAILNVVESSQFINGPEVRSFQQDLENYLDVKHVIPCANGTDALQISMMALGLQPGDEVITPSYTYIATTEVIGLLRLKPVFVDVIRTHLIFLQRKLKKRLRRKLRPLFPCICMAKLAI